MSDAYCDVLCDRLVFQHGNPRLKSEKRTQWTPAEIKLVKERSAFFKPLILFLQDDPDRPNEIVRFQSRSKHNSDNDASVDDFTTLPRFTTTDDTEYKFLADEFRPFLNKVLISREPLEKNKKFLWWVCKCAWMCKCPPDGFQCPSEILAPPWSFLGSSHYFIRGNGKAVAKKPADTSDTTRSFATRPWNSPRECTCRDDTCTCSLEFATICLWLGWKLEFKKHLRAAIWATYVGSLDLETPVKKLRNLREARTEARQHLLSDLQQYLKVHSKQWNALVGKETREKLEKYLKNSQEVLPGSLGRALEEKLACRDETNGTPPSPSSPKSARQAMKHDRRKSVTTTHTSGATSQNSGGSSGSGAAVGAGLVTNRVKDAYDVGLTEWTDELWDKLEKKNMARQDENNSFVRQMLEDLTAGADQRQDELAEDIWSWRLKEMEHWKWVLGIPKAQESNYRTAS